MPELTPEQTARVLEVAMDLARQGEADQLVEFIEHGLPVNAVDKQGNSLLMLSAYHGHAVSVRALIDRGADPDLRNERDQSAVAGALFKGEAEVVRVLVQAGADLDAGTPTGRDAATLFGQQHLIER